MNLTECKYGAQCYRKNCWFSHPAGRIIDLNQHMQMSGIGPIGSPERPYCRYGAVCHRVGCRFVHPKNQQTSDVSVAHIADTLDRTHLRFPPGMQPPYMHPGMPKWMANESARCMISARPMPGFSSAPSWGVYKMERMLDNLDQLDDDRAPISQEHMGEDYIKQDNQNQDALLTADS